MIIHRKLSKMKNTILPTCLQGNYRDSLGEFSNITTYGVVGAEMVKLDKGLANRHIVLYVDPRSVHDHSTGSLINVL